MKKFLSVVLCILNLNAAVVFHPYYDITFGGIERIHKFDAAKYGKIKNILVESGITKFYEPTPVTDEELLLAHTQNYLDQLNSIVWSWEIVKNLELYQISWGKYLFDPFVVIPNFLFKRYLLKPMKYAVGGTLLGVDLAQQHGWGINLSGGYHHAMADEGMGFCVYSDIALAARRLASKGKKVLIVDLDAHQGNGYESILKFDGNIYILDIYNPDIFPWDYEARKRIDFDYHVLAGIDDYKYLSLLEETLPKILDKVKPDFVLYNAGTDIYEHDPLGQLKITKDGIIKRDQFVFEEARSRNISILMVLSGGYAKDSARIVADSIVNLFKQGVIS